MFENLLRSVLLLVIAALLKLALDALGVTIDEATFNSIVAAIVAVILSLLGVEAVRKVKPSLF